MAGQEAARSERCTSKRGSAYESPAPRRPGKTQQPRNRRSGYSAARMSLRPTRRTRMLRLASFVQDLASGRPQKTAAEQAQAESAARAQMERDKAAAAAQMRAGWGLLGEQTAAPRGAAGQAISEMAPPKAAGGAAQDASPLSPRLERMEQRRRSLLQVAAMLSQAGNLEAAERSVAQADEVAHSIYGMLQQRARTDADVYRLLECSQAGGRPYAHAERTDGSALMEADRAHRSA